MQAVKEQIEQWYGCYGARGDLFTKESYRHPAKMAVGLCYRIFQHGWQRGYWKLGDTILDPMGGIGTTVIVGATLGYRVVLVELEEHFVRMAQGNIYLLWQKLGSCPLVEIVQGDARNLAALLSGNNGAGAVTSPPYAGEPRQGSDPNPERQQGGLWTGKYGGVISSPPYGDASLPAGVSHKVLALALEGKWEEAIAYSQEQEAEQVECGTRRSVRSAEATREAIERAIVADQGYSGVLAPPGPAGRGVEPSLS